MGCCWCCIIKHNTWDFRNFTIYSPSVLKSLNKYPIIFREINIPNFLVDRESAYLVEAGNPGSVAQAIENLIANEDQALKVGRAGRMVAEEHFDAAKNGARLVALLQGMG